MKLVVLASLVWLTITAQAQTYIVNSLRFGGGGGGGGPTYLLEENFENTGYDVAGWTEALNGGTADEDYTTGPLQGSQSLRIVTASGDQTFVYNAFSAGNERWFYFKVKPVAHTPSVMQLIQIWNSSQVLIARVDLNSSGTVAIFHGTASATTVGTMSNGTGYHVWAYFNNSSDTANVAFSTDGTRPTSGDNFAQVTTGTSTTDAAEIAVGLFGFDGVNEALFDRVLVDDEQIGNSP